MDRRQFVAASGAVAAFSILPSAAFAQGASGDAALNALFESIFQETLLNSPELASSLGLDKGANAALKSKLSPGTAAERLSDLERNRRAIADLRKIAPATLSPSAQLNREVVLYLLETRTIPAARFGIDSLHHFVVPLPVPGRNCVAHSPRFGEACLFVAQVKPNTLSIESDLSSTTSSSRGLRPADHFLTVYF